jgi:hypothetical protein
MERHGLGLLLAREQPLFDGGSRPILLKNSLRRAEQGQRQNSTS